jgi:hypothetical protein
MERVMRIRTSLALAAAIVLALPAGAQGPLGGRSPNNPSPLLDLLEILVLPREILAIDAGGGGQLEERLLRGERVLWSESQGRVGVVLTDQRILAVSTISASWQSTRYLRSEVAPGRATLGDRVALLLTDKRAIGFDGNSGNLIERSLGPGESILDFAVGANVAVVVTPRRALGLSPFAGGFFETDIHVGEKIEHTAAQANLVTITLSNRLLIFRAPTGTWEERKLKLR